MYENRAKRKLKSGEIVSIVGGVLTATGDGLDLLGTTGIDGCWLEGEHGPVTWDQMGDLSRACDLWGMSSIVRVHANEPGLITRTFDRGASGIVIPHVNTKAEAEAVVQAAKFAPIGLRGSFGGRRSYQDDDYFANANDDTIVIILIEDIEAVDNLDEILTVDHIDVFFVAPSDLAQTMGLVGQPWHPDVQQVVEDSLARIVAAGRTAGSLAQPDRLARYIELGARFFLTSSDAWVKEGAARLQAQFSGLA